MTNHANIVHREHAVSVLSGWIALPVVALLLVGGLAIAFDWLVAGITGTMDPVTWLLLGLLCVVGGTTALFGFFALQPNEARVLILFGDYKGTVRHTGFHWGNPFYSNSAQQSSGTATDVQAQTGTGKPAVATSVHRPLGRSKISLRARTLNGERLKVNDKRGNPIEIAAVVVWRVRDTAQASFDVDDYESYVRTQSESAVRHLASAYAYDRGEEDEITLRSNIEEVSQALRLELDERLSKAGVSVDEARLTHLAYAPEIAQAMLRRQQAEAVIAARQKIVQGAVSMVDMALKELAEKQIMQLDDERRAAMVSNLMVVLCSESEVHPVVNAGTLYT